MLRYLHILDDALIDRVFQPLSNWFHYWTGRDSVDQAQWVYRLSGFAWAGCCGWDMAHGQSWGIDAFLAFMTISGSFYYTSEERMIRCSAEKGLRNPRRLRPTAFYARIGFLFFFLLVIATDFKLTWLHAVLVTFVIRDYIYCCDSQGPWKGKIREWIENFHVASKSVPEAGRA
jgi:hypothetical protein